MDLLDTLKFINTKHLGGRAGARDMKLHSIPYMRRCAVWLAQLVGLSVCGVGNPGSIPRTVRTPDRGV